MGSRISSPSFIGRENELGVLDRFLDFENADQPPIALVEGEAGIGKSRLVKEATARARGRGSIVLWGACAVLGGAHLPYAPLIQALRSLTDQITPATASAALGAAATALSVLVPELGFGTTNPVASTIDQGALFELLLTALGALSQAAPVVLVIEDLHWVDPSTRRLIGFLAGNLGPERARVICTLRSDELHRRHPLAPLVGELERGRRAARLHVAPFGPQEVEAHVASLLTSPPSPDLVAETFVRSQGNPFIIEELIAAGGNPNELPLSLRDLFLTRAHGLSPEGHEVLAAIAIAGRASERILGEVTKKSVEVLEAALREAVDHHVLVIDADETIRFRHALMQQVVHDDLLPGERQRLHVAVATALEHSPYPDGDLAGYAARIAHHWYEAHDLPRALESAVRAGNAAETVAAYDEALEHYERALGVWDAVDRPESLAHLDRPTLQGRAGDAAGYSGQFDRAKAFLRAAIESVDHSLEPVKAGLLYVRLSRHLRVEGDLPSSIAASEQAMRLVPAHPSSPERACVLAVHAGALMLVERTADSRRCCEEAVEVAVQVGADADRAAALAILGVDLAILGEPERGIEALRQGLDLARRCGDNLGVGRAYNNLSWVLEYVLRLDEAVSVAFEGAEFAKAVGMGRTLGANLLLNAAWGLFSLGRWDEATVALERVEAWRPAGIMESNLRAYRAELEIARGRIEPAKSLLEWARSTSTQEPERAVEWFAAEARLHQLERDWAALQAAVSRGLAPAADADDPNLTLTLVGLGIRGLADRAAEARAHRRSEELAIALKDGGRLVDVARRIIDRPSPKSVLLAEACEAEWARLHDNSDPAQWRRLADASEHAGLRLDACYARFRQAEALLAERQRGEGAAALLAAFETAGNLGAQPLRDELVLLARRARVALESSGTGGSSARARDFGLSDREREVLGLVATGRSNAQIAAELFISPRTASSHVSHILTKMGVASRAEATALAYKAGLLGDQ